MKGICPNCNKIDYLYRVYVKIDDVKVVIEKWCKACLHNEKPPEEKK